jgi:CheY-like chemotaxis protein
MEGNDPNNKKKNGIMTYQDNFFLKKLFDLLSVNLYWKDTDFRYLGCNLAQIKSLGYSSSKEILGKTDYELSPRKIADALREIDVFVADSGVPIEVEERRVSKSGEIIVLLSRKVPLFDGKKKLKGIVSISVNITGLNEQSSAKGKTIYIDTKSSKQSIKPKVLLAEDSPLTQAVSENLLTSLSCEVDAVKTIRTAFNKFKNKSYNIAFIDLSLEDGHAIELVQKIRDYEQENELNAMPVIGFTAHANPLTKKLCRQAKFNELLKKPILKNQAEQLLVTYIPNYLASNNLDVYQNVADLSGEIIDDDKLKEIIDDSSIDPKETIFPMMHQSLQTNKPKIKSAWKNKNWSALQFLIHKLRGSAAYSAAIRLEKACGLVEEYLENKEKIKKVKVDILAKQVLTEIDHLKEKLLNRMPIKK